MSSSESKLEVEPRDLKWIKVIGQGGFGIVRKCRYRGGVYAVKFLKDPKPNENNASIQTVAKYKATIETERDIICKLKSQFVLLPEAFGKSSSGDPIIVTEYATYGDLLKVLRPNLAVHRRVQMALEVAQGLYYLHDRKPEILHLDIKPANILVFRDYQVKIGDLGMAEILQDGGRIPAEVLKGSLQYASPEALSPQTELIPGKGVPGLTTKSDIFSFAMVLYQMFYGKEPFKEEKDTAAANNAKLDYYLLRSKDPKLRPELDNPPAAVPAEMWTLIRQCWAHDPQDRPDCDEIIRKLEAIQTTLLEKGPSLFDPLPPAPLAAKPPATSHHVPNQGGADNTPVQDQSSGFTSTSAEPSKTQSPFEDDGCSFGMDSMSGGTWCLRVGVEEQESLRSVFSEEVFHQGCLQRFARLMSRILRMRTARKEVSTKKVEPRLSAKAAEQRLLAKSEVKLNRMLGHTLKWLSMDKETRMDRYSANDLMNLVNAMRQGWQEADLDVLPLSHQATDWLVGTWGALVKKYGKQAPQHAYQVLSKAAQVAVDNRVFGLQDGGYIEAALGDGSPIHLQEILEHLKARITAEDTEQEALPYFERMQLEWVEQQKREQELNMQARVASWNDKWLELLPGLEYLERQKAVMGARYPDGLFIPPVVVDEETRNKMFDVMRSYWSMWDEIKILQYKGLLPDYFWQDKRWPGRGSQYRHLCEPLDIAYWYFRNKQFRYREKYDCIEEGYHYNEGIVTVEDERQHSNHRRPGRYRIMQQAEFEVLGSTETSMDAARWFRATLKNQRWQEVFAEQLGDGELGEDEDEQ